MQVSQPTSLPSPVWLWTNRFLKPWLRQLRKRRNVDGEQVWPWESDEVDGTEGGGRFSYPSGVQWSMIPPIVRSVSIVLSGQA